MAARGLGSSLLLSMVFLWCCVACGQTLSSQTRADVDAVVSAGLKCHKTPGLAISVVQDGKVVVSKGYGVEDLTTGRPVTSSTLFGIASLTKAFTATLLAKLLEGSSDYKVSTNVYKILGRNLFNNTLRSTYATLEDLLAHRMGIPRHNFLRLGQFSRAELVSKVKYLPSRGAFRDSFTYSDLMYGLVTRIIEMLGNATWEEQVQQQLFLPLGMRQSTFDARLTETTPSLASPYVLEDGGRLERASLDFIRHWGALGGSGTIVSTAEDMARWMMFHLSGGQTQGGQRLLGGAALNDTYRARTALDYSSATRKYFTRPGVPVTMSNDAYSLGWKKGYYRGLPMLQHSGSTWGYRAMLTLIPSQRLGIFTSMTGTDPDYLFRLSLHGFLADVTLGETPWLNASTICTFPDPWQRQSSDRHASFEDLAFMKPHAQESVQEFSSRASRQSLAHFAGRYHHGAYGDLDVTLTSQGLQATFGFAKWELHPTLTPNSLKAKWVKDPPRLDFTFNFLVNSRGEAYALTVPGFETSDPPVFYRSADDGGGGGVVVPIG